MFSSIPARRLVASLVAVGVLGVSSYAFLGSITGLETAGRAGAASQTVSGYAISDINYSFNSGDPNKIDKLTFTLDGPATMVKARLAAAGPFYGCATDDAATASVRAVSGQESWTALSCDTTAPQATVLEQDELSVVAHS